MKRKEVDDVLGGKDAWKNVDKSEGELGGFVGWRGLALEFEGGSRVGEDVQDEISCFKAENDSGAETDVNLFSQAQCTREGCDGTQAYFKQIQIRSADEPMTIFYRVKHHLPSFAGIES